MIEKLPTYWFAKNYRNRTLFDIIAHIRCSIFYSHGLLSRSTLMC